MTVFVTSKSNDGSLGISWPLWGRTRFVDMEQIGPGSYKLTMESSDWRYLIKVIDYLQLLSFSPSTIGITNPPILEYRGLYSNNSCYK